ncbi:MAG: hypothetical protein WC350_02875 [Candidatus Micrarchaeia archaeon]|jgi:hypothetical protein
MVVGLISPHEERQLFERLVEYYKKLYPKLKFGTKETILEPNELASVLYTYPGEEAEATSGEKMKEIRDAINFGYDTPAILLQRGKDYIVLDGHRRLRVARERRIKWKALVITAPAGSKFGIEKMVMGKVGDLF